MTGPAEGFRCAIGARLRGDPLAGTAVPARRWLLVEQASGWTADAFGGLQAPAEEKVALARLMLIRRPGAHRRGATRRWCVIDTEPPSVELWGALGEDGSLASALEALEAPRAAPATERFGPILVCANGRKDPCCAIAGRTVAAALAQAWPERVWECTHTGGDRFAANVIVLPEGACYGGLSEATAAGVIASLDRGVADLAHFRGVTGRGAREQVALAAAGTLLGVPPWDRARLTVAAHRQDVQWWAEVGLDGALAVIVEGHDEVRPAHHLTCGAVRPTKATAPIVDRVRRGGAASG